jgi:hypothetical protein
VPSLKLPKETKPIKPTTKYQPSLIGLALGETITKAPSLATGVGVRFPVVPKPKRKKKRRK